MSSCEEGEPYALQVLDDSMEPEFQKGCIIIIDPTGLIEHDAYVLAHYEDDIVFRKLVVDNDNYLLRAENNTYNDLNFSEPKKNVKGIIVQRAGKSRKYHKRYDKFS